MNGLQGCSRHIGLWCGCPLIECCHNEDTGEGERWRVVRDPLCCGYGAHVHSGSPVSGFTQPWEPGDEPWRETGQTWRR